METVVYSTCSTTISLSPKILFMLPQLLNTSWNCLFSIYSLIVVATLGTVFYSGRLIGRQFLCSSSLYSKQLFKVLLAAAKSTGKKLLSGCW